MKNRRLNLIPFILLFVISGCNEESFLPIPDLNPDTTTGGEMLIYDIEDIMAFNGYEGQTNSQFDSVSRQYDISDNGIVDFRLEGQLHPETGLYSIPHVYLVLNYIGEVMISPDVSFELPGYNNSGEESPVFLPVDALIGTTVEGIWSTSNSSLHIVFEEYLQEVWNSRFRFPVGLSYIPVRRKDEGQYYYGWIELLASDHEDDNVDDYVIIKRFGISQTPDLRVRMGKDY